MSDEKSLGARTNRIQGSSGLVARDCGSGRTWPIIVSRLSSSGLAPYIRVAGATDFLSLYHVTPSQRQHHSHIHNRAGEDINNTKMRSTSLATWATASLGASALQLQRPMQMEVNHHQAQAPLAAPKPAQEHLPLIDSEDLQSRISSKNLHDRAKELYDIAKLGEKEFGNPTRVIGSKGEPGNPF